MRVKRKGITFENDKKTEDIVINHKQQEEELISEQNWDERAELLLFQLVIKFKPVGLAKHWKMLLIRRELAGLLGAPALTSETIWSKLGTFFDLDAIEEEHLEESCCTVESVPVEFTLPANLFSAPASTVPARSGYYGEDQVLVVNSHSARKCYSSSSSSSSSGCSSSVAETTRNQKAPGPGLLATSTSANTPGAEVPSSSTKDAATTNTTTTKQILKSREKN